MAKFGAKEVFDATLYDMETEEPVITFDTLKTGELNVTTERVYARGGRGNAKLLTWEINKEATLRIEDALLSPKSIELLSGVATAVGAKTIYMRQSTEWDVSGATSVDKGGNYPLTCNSSSGSITLAFTPTSAVADIKVYLADDDCGTAIDMTGATLSANTLTLGTNGKATAGGKKVVVYYKYLSAATAETYIIDSEHMSGTYKLVGTTVVRNQDTGKDESFQIMIPSLKWSSAMTMNFSADGDPSVQSFECEIQKPSGSSTMIEMTRY